MVGAQDSQVFMVKVVVIRRLLCSDALLIRPSVIVQVTHIQRRLTGGKVGGSAFKHGGGRRGVPPATAVISDDMLRRGIASRGNEVRARRLIQQLLDGKGASVGAS